MINDQAEDLDCNPIRDRESTQGEHLQPRNGLGTQLAYNIGVLGNNSRDVLGTKEGGGILTLHYPGGTDSSEDYETEEGSQDNETGSFCARNVEVIDVDCLSLENRVNQDHTDWNSVNKAMEIWGQKARMVRNIWSGTKIILVCMGFFDHNRLNTVPQKDNRKITDESQDGKSCFQMSNAGSALHNCTKISQQDILGHKRLLPKLNKDFIGITVEKTLNTSAKPAICVLQESNLIDGQRHPWGSKMLAALWREFVSTSLGLCRVQIMPNICSWYLTISQKWLDAIPIESTDAKTVASKLIERFISVFGSGVQLRITSISGGVQLIRD